MSLLALYLGDARCVDFGVVPSWISSYSAIMGVRPLVRRARTVFQRLSSGDNDSVDGETIEQRIVRENRSAGKGSWDGSGDTFRNCSGSGSWNEQRPDENVQHGVQDVQAVAMTWSRGTLIAIFIK